MIDNLSEEEIVDHVKEILLDLTKDSMVKTSPKESTKWLRRYKENIKQWIDEMDDTSSSDIWNYSMTRLRVLKMALESIDKHGRMDTFRPGPCERDEDNICLKETHYKLCMKLEPFLNKSVEKLDQTESNDSCELCYTLFETLLTMLESV